MPSKKAHRVSERKRIRNASTRSQVKTFIYKVRGLLDSNDIEKASSVAEDAQVALDKAAQKGILHKKNVARRKSRMMKSVNASRGN